MNEGKRVCIGGRCPHWDCIEGACGCMHDDLYDEENNHIYDHLAVIEDGYCPFGLGKEAKNN